MSRRTSYSSYSSYLNKRVKDQCCNGGGTNEIQDLTSQRDFTQLEGRVSNLESSFSLITEDLEASINILIQEISSVDVSLSSFKQDISLIDSSLNNFTEIIENLEISLNDIWESSSFEDLTRIIREVSSVAYGVSSDFYRFLDGSLQAQNISAVTIDVSNLKIGGENFDIRELSSVAYGVSSDFYRFLDGSLEAQNISAVTIDVSNLNIGGSSFSISGSDLYLSLIHI